MEMNYGILKNMCIMGNLNNIKKIIHIHPEFMQYGNNEKLFIIACSEGHLDIVKWLFKSILQFNILVTSEKAFDGAYYNNHFEIMIWLIINIPSLIHIFSSKYNKIFENACNFNYINIAKKIHKLFPYKYRYILEEDIIVDYEIEQLHIIDSVIVTEIDECPICMSKQCEIRTMCGHHFCKECISTIKKNNNCYCPFCRDNLSDTFFYLDSK